MKKAIITRNGIVTNEATMPEAELLEWIEKHKALRSFGANEYSYEEVVEVTPAVLDEEGNEITPAVTQTNTITVPAEYELVIEDITAQLEAEAILEDKIAKGKKSREVCDKVLDVISGFNQDRELTEAQIMSMINTFTQADFYLTKKMPKLAKTAIQAITPDGVIVTQEMKDACLTILADY